MYKDKNVGTDVPDSPRFTDISKNRRNPPFFSNAVDKPFG